MDTMGRSNQSDSEMVIKNEESCGSSFIQCLPAGKLYQNIRS